MYRAGQNNFSPSGSKGGDLGKREIRTRKTDELKSEIGTQDTRHEVQPATSRQLVQHPELLWILLCQQTYCPKLTAFPASHSLPHSASREMILKIKPDSTTPSFPSP